MRRVFLLFVIVAMCALVVIGGNITFVNSNSVLKDPARKNTTYEIVVDTAGNRLYLLKEGNLVKSYPVSLGKGNAPSPIGNWEITQKTAWKKELGDCWLGLNVPWGTYWFGISYA